METALSDPIIPGCEVWVQWPMGPGIDLYLKDSAYRYMKRNGITGKVRTHCRPSERVPNAFLASYEIV